ncbi:MAG: hypothetical protein ACI955_000238 [Zhongshania sp.]|jgi:hypothetical protein
MKKMTAIMKFFSIFLIVILIGCCSTALVRCNPDYKGQNNSGLGVDELLNQFKSYPEVDVGIECGWQVSEVNLRVLFIRLHRNRTRS